MFTSDSFLILQFVHMKCLTKHYFVSKTLAFHWTAATRTSVIIPHSQACGVNEGVDCAACLGQSLWALNIVTSALPSPGLWEPEQEAGQRWRGGYPHVTRGSVSSAYVLAAESPFLPAGRLDGTWRGLRATFLSRRFPLSRFQQDPEAFVFR